MRLPVILSVYAATFPLVSLVAPKGTVPLLILATLAGAVAAWLERRRPRWPGRGLLAVLAMFLAWALASAAWSLDPALSLRDGARIGATLLTGIVFLAIAASLATDERTRVLKWLTIGIVAIMALLAAEYLLGYPLLHLIYLVMGHSETKPLLAGQIMPPRYNRGVTALALAVWPALALMARGSEGTSGARRAAPWLLFAAAAIALVLSNSAAGVVALAIGGAMWGLSRIAPKAGRALVIVVPVVVLIGAPFAAREMRDAGLQHDHWLFNSAQHRVEIWGFTADIIAGRPLQGWGLGASRSISELKPKSETTGRPLMLLHPHNAALQILLELGAVGGALALAAVLLVARDINRAPARTRPYLHALFAGVLVVASVSFGLWQAHWLATIIGVAALARLTLLASGGAAQQRQTAQAPGEGLGG